MGRSNNAARARNARGRLNRRVKGESRHDHKVRAIPRIDAADLIIPDGTCLRNPRRPKARFDSREKAAAALKQAQTMRKRAGSGHMEQRFYLCKTEDGGCGGHHLTSRESYTPGQWSKNTEAS